MAQLRTLALFIIYWLLVTPVGLVLRLTRDPLHRRWDRSASTYWDVLVEPSDSR